MRQSIGRMIIVTPMLMLIFVMQSFSKVGNDTMNGNHATPYNEGNQGMNSSNQNMVKESKDAEFIAEAMASNVEEIKMAKLGEAKSSDTDLQNIAKTLETDHTKMLNDLKNMSNGKYVSHPAVDSSKAMADAKMLTNSKPDDFDKTWTDMMIEGHRATINKFKNAMNEVNDQQLKYWISAGIPKIQMHLDKLTALRSKLK